MGLAFGPQAGFGLDGARLEPAVLVLVGAEFFFEFGQAQVALFGGSAAFGLGAQCVGVLGVEFVAPLGLGAHLGGVSGVQLAAQPGGDQLPLLPQEQPAKQSNENGTDG